MHAHDPYLHVTSLDGADHEHAAALLGRGMADNPMHIGRLDSVGAVGYLETDRPEAVGFYRRFGYVVVAETVAVGVRTWFMRRPPV